jgi:hypothetical protein
LHQSLRGFFNLQGKKFLKNLKDKQTKKHKKKKENSNNRSTSKKTDSLGTIKVMTLDKIRE